MGCLHSLALKNDVSVVAWAITGYGETNVPVAAQSGMAAIAVGSVASMALRGNGWELGAPLALQPSGNATVPSRPTNATRFPLQSAASLTPPVTWTDVTNPPALLGGLLTVTNPRSSLAQFFRLRKP